MGNGNTHFLTQNNQASATVPFYIFYFTVLQKDVIRDIMKLSHIGENMTSQELYTAIHKEYERLKSVLQTNDLNAIIEQTLKVHAMVHPKIVSGAKQNTIADYVLDYMLKDDNKSKLVPRMDCGVDLDWAGTDKVPMCWHFWHTYRIEDLVSNILIADKPQIFNVDVQKKIGAPITDTGNALEFDEAVEFGKRLNVAALKDYNIAVGKNTRKIIENLTLEQINSMVPEERVMQILRVGGVTTDVRSVWLLVYWGRLTVGGMILTPLTDHHMMHLPPCLKNLPIL